MLIRAIYGLVVILLAIGFDLTLPSDAHALFLRGAIGASGGSYIGPGDITTFDNWWGLRAYSSVQANGTTNIAKIKRASDSTSINIVALTNGQFDIATASAFCATTTCTVIELYDQVSGNNLTTTFNTFPNLVFNCQGSYPCMQGHTATTSLKATVSITPTNGNGSQYMVGNTYAWASGGVTGMFDINSGSLYCICMTHEQVANHWDLSNNALVYTATANDGAWHVGEGLSLSGTNTSDMVIDGTDHFGTAYGSTVVGAPQMEFGDSTSVVGMETEEYGWKDSTVWSHSSPSATACLIAHNVGTFYGITVGGSC